MKCGIELFDIGVFRVEFFKGELIFNVLPEKQDEVDLLMKSSVGYSITYFINAYGDDLAKLKMLVFDEMLRGSFKTRYNMCLNHTVSIYGDDILKVVNYV